MLFESLVEPQPNPAQVPCLAVLKYPPPYAGFDSTELIEVTLRMPCRQNPIRLTSRSLAPGFGRMGAVPHGAEHMNVGGCVACRGCGLAHRLVLLAMLGLLLSSGCAGGPKVILPE